MYQQNLSINGHADVSNESSEEVEEEDEVLVVLANSLKASIRHTLRCSSISDKFSSADLVLVFIYGMFAVVGLPGNCWVIINNALKLRTLSAASNLRTKRKRHIMTLILCLSIADTLVLICLPLIVTDMLMMCWPFGEWICKLLWICETPNKILSTFLLVALSANSYLALYYRDFYVTAWLRRRCTVILVLLCVLVAVLSTLPVFLYANVYAVGFRRQQRAELYTQKCLFNAPADFQRGFSLYTFGIGFCLSSCLQTLFYASVVSKVYTHTKQCSVSSQISFWKVTKNSLLLVLFYFLCWTPSWVVILYVQFTQDIPRFLGYIAYVLPYLNSAVNPTLYHRLNRLEDKDFSINSKQLRTTRHFLPQVRSNSSVRSTTVTAEAGLKSKIHKGPNSKVQNPKSPATSLRSVEHCATDFTYPLNTSCDSRC